MNEVPNRANHEGRSNLYPAHVNPETGIEMTASEREAAGVLSPAGQKRAAQREVENKIQDIVDYHSDDYGDDRPSLEAQVRKVIATGVNVHEWHESLFNG